MCGMYIYKIDGYMIHTIHACMFSYIHVLMCADRAVSEYYHLRDKVLSLDNELKKVSVSKPR